MEQEFITLKEIAKKIGKSEETVRTWIIKKKEFENAFKGPYGSWCVPKKDFEVFFQKYKKAQEEDEWKDVLGKKIGYLTITEDLGYKKYGKRNIRYVKLDCECGETVEKPLTNVKKGITSCSNSCLMNAGFKIGETYGNLTIIEDLGLLGKQKRRYVLVKCKCEKQNKVTVDDLKYTDRKYCSKKCNFRYEDLTHMIGKKVGFLTVIEEKMPIQMPRIFICKCDCGKVVEKRYTCLKNKRTSFCKHNCKKKRGENTSRWNPELTWEERIQGRDYFEYNEWREKVYIRDFFTCQCCKKRGGVNLVAHHKDGYNWCIEKRINVHNGVTLCEECHDDFHKEYGFGDNTEEQYITWLNSKKVSV